MRVVLQDQLLEKQEGSLVMDALPQLHLRLPSVRRISLLTVVTLQILDQKLDLERLLEKRIDLHFFLNGQLDFDSARVRLSPDKRRVE